MMNDHEKTRYLNKIKTMDANQYREERLEILSIINGNVFYPLCSWPRKIVLAFFKKPHTDKDTLIIFLFLRGINNVEINYIYEILTIIVSILYAFLSILGNGCGPYYVIKWLLSSQQNNPKANKRLHQIKWLMENYHKKCNHWYYYDMQKQRYLYLNGSRKYI